MMKASELLDRIREIWNKCTSSKALEFVDVVRLLWPLLDNNCTMVDVAGVWSVAAGDGLMDQTKFGDFLNALAKVRFPNEEGKAACPKLVDEILALLNKKDSPFPPGLSSVEFHRSVDRSCLQELLKVDTLLKNAFATFAGESVSMTGSVIWEEVRKMSLGMEVEGYLNFADAYSIIPELLSEKQCAALAKNIMDDYRVEGNDRTGAPLAALLYPQFELLICFTAIAVFENRALAALKARPPKQGAFARKVSEVDAIQAANVVNDFFKMINLGKSLSTLSSLHRHKGNNNDGSAKNTAELVATGPITAGKSTENNSSSRRRPELTRSTRCEDQYTSALKHGRQAMVFRMQDLFEEIKDSLYSLLSDAAMESTNTSDVLRLVDSHWADSEVLNVQQRFASKPVVITDAIPLPADQCPLVVQQLLKSALAHHNLGSFEESLMFFEAAVLQFGEIAKLDSTIDAAFAGDDTQHQEEPAVPLKMPLSVELYIIIGKGNVYRSCGEDEQSLMEYMIGWRRAKEARDRDWEHIFVNSMGSLAYYSIRYDIALLCFHAVVQFRNAEYGQESADTATALNNEGCCLYGMVHRGEARLRFEKAWMVDCKVLGHRAPRTVLIWQNLDKARRSVAAADPKSQTEEMKERVNMRSDADMLLIGGKFTIKAMAPPNGKSKKKGKGGGGGKKGGKKKKK